MSDRSANEVPNAILILKSNPLALQSAEQFLRSRGWLIFSAIKLSDALQILFENKIDYFLICANHPQKKVKTFPKLLAQFQQLRLITYTDIANTLNMAILQEMGVPYQILPPVSGPAIERTVIRIEKEVLSSKSISHAAPTKGFLSSFKAPEARKEAQEKLTLFFSNDSDENLPKLDTNDSGTRRHAESFTEYEERIRNEAAGEFTAQVSRTAIDPSDNASLPASNDARPPNSRITPSSFQKGIEKTLASSVKSSHSPMPVERLERAENCICLKIEAEHFRGYLVAAMGRNRRFDDALLLNIEAKLFDYLRNEGLFIQEDKTIEIKVRPVDFESWALEKADFLKKSIHDGNEVAMAFFPTEKLTPNIGKSVAIDMVSIDIDDLVTNQAVTFDVYVHLPANNKYILYTPKGGVFLNSQKERLKAKGVDKMHMKKESTPELQKYHVENTLNNSILDFEAKKGRTKKKA